MEWLVIITPRPLYSRERDPVHIAQGAVWTTGQAWTGVENLASHWDSISGPSSPERVSLLNTPGRGGFIEYRDKLVNLFTS